MWQIPKLIILAIMGAVVFYYLVRTQKKKTEYLAKIRYPNPSKLGISSSIDAEPFFQAIEENDIDTARNYLDEGTDPNVEDDNGNTALLYASTLGATSIVNFLLEKGADPNRYSVNGFVPLHFAVFNNYIDTVHLLLKYGANPDPCNPNGYTPLYDASDQGHIEITRTLIEHRADVSARGGDNSTPLHAAAYHGYTKLVELLFDAEADPFTKNDQGVTPLMVAGIQEHGDIMRIFISKKADKSKSCGTYLGDDLPYDVKKLCLEAAILRQDYDKKENIIKAEALYREAAKRTSDCWMAHFGLGEALSVRVNNEQIRRGQFVEEMLAELKKACALAPERREPQLKLAAEYAKTNPRAAEVVFRTAIDTCSNCKGSVYPIDWQAGDYWSIATSASENHETINLSLEAFCRAIFINPQYYGSYIRPASHTATAIWNTAKLILQENELSSDEAPDILGQELSTKIQNVWEEQVGRIMKLHNSSLHYSQLYKNKQDPNYLHKALEIENEAWKLVHEDFPERYKIASHLGYLFQEHYELEKDLDALFKSKELFQLTLSLTDDTDPKRANYYDNLNIAFYRLFEYDSDRANLEQSIEAINNAISITAVESPSMPLFLSNLGVRYLALYRITSAMNDLHKAQNLLEQAIEKSDHGSPDRAIFHTHYGSILRILYIRKDKLNFLNEAIDHIEKAIDITPDTTANKKDLAIRFHNLGNAFSERFRKTNDKEDIERSIECHNKALKISANLARKASLANTLRTRYVAFNSTDDLEKSIGLLEHIVDTCSPDSPAYSDYLCSLGLVLQERYALWGGNDDLESSIKYLKKAAKIGATLSLPTSLDATKIWLNSAYYRQSWAEAIQAYTAAKVVRERILEKQLLRQDKESWLYETQGMATKGAYAYYKENRFREAVEAVEQGLSRLLSDSLARERFGLERLRSTGNENLYSKYKLLVDRWRKIISQTENDISLHEDLKILQENFHQTLIEIRQLKGFEKFFSLPNYEDIKKATTDLDPIVYLFAADIEGVALAVGINEENAQRNGYAYVDGVCGIKLPEFTNNMIDRMLGSYLDSYNEFLEKTLLFGDTLSFLEDFQFALDRTTKWLWSAVMSRIVNIVPRDTHVTLIPVGKLSLLPFHAAWMKDPKKACGRRYALDDLVISYAPNAQSLVAASNLANQLRGEKCLGIDEPQGKGSLPSSHQEVKTICSFFRHHTVLHRENATVKAVLSELDKHDVAHFACHGKADLDSPLHSKLIMAHNQPITLEDLIKLHIKGLRLVLLSACESGITGVKLPDEHLNLPSGFLQARTAGVVSSLWSVFDTSTMLLMIRFYEVWKKNNLEAPTEALREAQQWVRDSSESEKIAVIAKADQIIGGSNYNSMGSDSQQNQIETDNLDFSHPFYWAAFMYTGK